MSISASAGNVDAIVRLGPGKSVFEDGRAASTSSSTWFQGELLCLDSSGHYLRRVAATGDAATLCGISDNAVTSGKLVGPYDGLTAVNAASVGPGFVGPKYGVIANLVLKTSDAFTMGCKVYLADGATTSTVSVTDPGDGNYVGIFQGPAAVASASAGQLGQILLVTRYPAVAL